MVSCTDDTLVDGLEADVAMKGSVNLVRLCFDMEAVVAQEIPTTVGVAVNWSCYGVRSPFCVIALPVRSMCLRSKVLRQPRKESQQ